MAPEGGGDRTIRRVGRAAGSALNPARGPDDNRGMSFWAELLSRLFGRRGRNRTVRVPRRTPPPTRAATSEPTTVPAWAGHAPLAAAEPYAPGTVQREERAELAAGTREARDVRPGADAENGRGTEFDPRHDSGSGPGAEGEREAPRAPLPRRGGISRFDRAEALTVILEGPEEEILWAIARRIERGKLDLPTLPSTSMAVIDLANNPTVEFQALVARISADPVLSSELLRTANSVLYASEEPVDTLHAAIVRIGLRALRSMIFSVSMRGTILRAGPLSDYAEDVWRQAHSVATVARAIAPALSFDPEKAFLLGLLHDLGKISLLAMLSRELSDQRQCTPALVGRVFQAYHQEAGAAMAKKWRLPGEFVAVAGCHHAWEENRDYTRSAAFVHVAHHLDLALTLGDRELWRSCGELPALVHLAPQADLRERVLSLAEAAHRGTPAATT